MLYIHPSNVTQVICLFINIYNIKIVKLLHINKYMNKSEVQTTSFCCFTENSGPRWLKTAAAVSLRKHCSWTVWNTLRAPVFFPHLSASPCNFFFFLHFSCWKAALHTLEHESLLCTEKLMQAHLFKWGRCNSVRFQATT